MPLRLFALLALVLLPCQGMAQTDCLNEGGRFIDLLDIDCIHARDKIGRTPLHRAALSGNEETTMALINAGANIKARSNDGWTPLHMATSEETIMALIKAGANIEARAVHGQTPLHGAAAYGNEETVVALLEAGANAKARDENGHAPFDLIDKKSPIYRTEAYWLLQEAHYE